MELCPLDTRYRKKTENLRPYFSNFAYTKYRSLVEFTYFYSIVNFVSKPPPEWMVEINNKSQNVLEYCLNNHRLTKEAYEEIINIEATTNHDVKAIEYFVKSALLKRNTSIKSHIEFVHFGLTSQDINNVALTMMTKEAVDNVIIPQITHLASKIRDCGKEWKNIVMLAKTHGQPAVPTTLGKEFMVYWERLRMEINRMTDCKNSLSTKMGGAVGNLNAHYAAYPKEEWEVFFIKYLENLGLRRQYYTTQIEHYDGLAALFDSCRRINTILKDFCQDIWMYISMEYLSQKVVETETGSSTMPHKVNPILFENAEGNIAISNALFELFSNKLPVSRLQRDLTDSTVVRNIGMGFGYMIVALQSAVAGIGKITPNMQKIKIDLHDHHYVIVEGIQTILRKHNVENPYEMMKELTRGRTPTDSELKEFIRNLHISDEIKREILDLSIDKYTGNSKLIQ